MDEVVTPMIQSEATLSALLFLLKSDDELAGKSIDVDKKKALSLGQLLDKTWARKWYVDATPTKDLRAKMPKVVET